MFQLKRTPSRSSPPYMSVAFSIGASTIVLPRSLAVAEMMVQSSQLSGNLATKSDLSGRGALEESLGSFRSLASVTLNRTIVHIHYLYPRAICTVAPLLTSMLVPWYICAVFRGNRATKLSISICTHGALFTIHTVNLPGFDTRGSFQGSKAF